METHCDRRHPRVNPTARFGRGGPAGRITDIVAQSRYTDLLRTTDTSPRTCSFPRSGCALRSQRPARRRLAAGLAAAGALAAGALPGCGTGSLAGSPLAAAINRNPTLARTLRCSPAAPSFADQPFADQPAPALPAVGPAHAVASSNESGGGVRPAGYQADRANCEPEAASRRSLDGLLKRVFEDDSRAYVGDPGPAETLTHATAIAEPAGRRLPAAEAISEAPMRVDSALSGGETDRREVWDLSLDRAIKLTLERTRVIRDAGQFGSDNNPLLSQPLAVVSVFDPAIQETGVGFNRGVEAALADFDAQFTTSYVATRDERIQNNPFVTGADAGDTLVTEDGQFRSSIAKPFATGGQATFSTEIDRGYDNVRAQLFPSDFNTNLVAQFRQPLLAGAGTRFNRIAGPNARNSRFLGVLDQGVLIARINGDQSIADFEREVRNLLREVERAYWDLATAYHSYDAEATAKAALLDIYRNVRVRSEEALTGGGTADLALALDQYRDAEFRTREARGELLTRELNLRRLMNLPVSDGRVIRPTEEPVTAQFNPDWRASLSGALVNRVELRRQKWQIKSLTLQLEAARNAARPQLDLVSGYRVNGFGDRLRGAGNIDIAGAEAAESALERLAQGDQTGWTLGVEFSMPVGLRAAKTQIQNVELRLAKARATLDAQEHEISHELANAFQEVARQYGQATTALARREAAAARVAAFDALRDTAQGDLDLLLRSEVSLAQAETQYWRSVYAYNQAIADVFHRQGTLLERDGVFLAEGDWRPEAYRDATREAWARANAISAPRLETDPAPFARPVPRPVPLPDPARPAPLAPVVPPAPDDAGGRLNNPGPAPAPIPLNGEALPIPDDRPDLSPPDDAAPKSGVPATDDRPTDGTGEPSPTPAPDDDRDRSPSEARRELPQL